MLDKNSINGDADQMCSPKLEVFTADCLLPEVVCTCCSTCCEDDDKDCNSNNDLANYDASFESGYARDGYELNPEKFVPAN